MLLEELPSVLKRLRRGPLVEPGQGRRVQHGIPALHRLLPHRPPLLLIDTIDAVDLETGSVTGSRWLDPSDPVYQGHFPDAPIYPGVLLVEAMGQLAATLSHFVGTGSVQVPEATVPRALRATRIHHAAFYEACVPDDRLTLHATVVADALTMIAAAHVYRRGQLAALTVLEVLTDEDEES